MPGDAGPLGAGRPSTGVGQELVDVVPGDHVDAGIHRLRHRPTERGLPKHEDRHRALHFRNGGRRGVDHALIAIWNDGTWREIYEKWVGMKSDLKIKYEESGFTMHIRR